VQIIAPSSAQVELEASSVSAFGVAGESLIAKAGIQDVWWTEPQSGKTRIRHTIY
jgi:hypothetical protein